MRTLDGDETREALRLYGLDRPSGVGFAFFDRARNIFYDWHAHDYHQLIYAMDGPTQVETAKGRHLLPARCAAWIPAGVRHRTLISDTRAASLYFSPEIAPELSGRVRILVVNPLMREMILHSARWPLGADETDRLAGSFLRSLALLCGEWREEESPVGLPSADHPAIARAMDYALADIAGATLAGAIAVAGMSERSFRRWFGEETGTSWQVWLGQARISTAMGQLAAGGRVGQVASDVGYASLSAFAQAFTKLAGETPARFRIRHRSAKDRLGLRRSPAPRD